jgi:adenine-specific DNA-methyltransferase
MNMKALTAKDAETHSPDVVTENITELKALFPEAFTEGKVDFEVLKGLLGGAVDEREEKYGLNWYGKRRARQLALTPSIGTLRPSPEDSVDWDTTQNLMIEGDNLEVLKLLQKSYAGKVKLIYIDPPYNTGSDFVYKDDFQDNIRNYLELTGQLDGNGSKLMSNTETSGRFHTDWLCMMYPRLRLARNLLCESGCFAVSIGEGEIGNLILVCNEVFGEENLVTICSRVMKTGGQKGVHFSPSVDYILIYAKDIVALEPFRQEISQNVIDKVYTKIEAEGLRKGENYRSMGLYQAMLDKRANQRFYIQCPDGELVLPPGDSFPPEKKEGDQVAPGDGDGVWRWTYARYSREKAEGNIEFIRSDRTSLITPDGSKASWNVYYKIWLSDRLEDGQLPGNILEKFESRHSSAELKALSIPFDFAKPSALIKFLMTICGVKDNELVLDFFAGSGSTAHAVMELSHETQKNRRFICVQLPEPTGPDSEERKAGFATISGIAIERIKRVGRKLREGLALGPDVDFGFRVFKLASSNIKAWEPDRDDLPKTLSESVEHLKTDRTEADILFELLLKLGLDLTVPIEEKKIAGKTVHSIGAGTLLVCLAPKVASADVEKLALGMAEWHKQLAPAGVTTVVFRDSAFADDVAKTNLTAILQQHGLETVRSL